MKFELEPTNNGVRIINVNKEENLDFGISDSIDLSVIVEDLSNIIDNITLDYNKFVAYSENNKEDINYSEIISLGRMILSIFKAHEKTIDELQKNN